MLGRHDCSFNRSKKSFFTICLGWSSRAINSVTQIIFFCLWNIIYIYKQSFKRPQVDATHKWRDNKNIILKLSISISVSLWSSNLLLFGNFKILPYRRYVDTFHHNSCRTYECLHAAQQSYCSTTDIKPWTSQHYP